MLAWFARCCGIDDRPDDAPAAPAGAPRGVQMAPTRSGNYVQLQQALDQAAQAVAQATAAAAAQQQGPPPASAKTLSRIPIVRVVADDLTEDNECCTICLDAHVPGELAARLPCGHLFHKDCVMEWLRRQPNFVAVTSAPLFPNTGSTLAKERWWVPSSSLVV